MEIIISTIYSRINHQSPNRRIKHDPKRKLIRLLLENVHNSTTTTPITEIITIRPTLERKHNETSR